MEQAIFALLGGICMAGIGQVLFGNLSGERPEPGYSEPPYWWPESLSSPET